jgi:hypothetical protein
MSQTLPPVSADTSKQGPPEWTPSREGPDIVPNWECSYTWHGDSRWKAVLLLLMGLAILAAGGYMVGADLEENKMLLFLIGLIWLFGGFAMVGSGMLLLFNSTTLRLRDGWLQIQEGPLPWPCTRNLPVGQIRSLKIGHEHGTQIVDTGDTAVTTEYNYYSLSAHLDSGESVTLLDKFEYPGSLE